MNEIAKCELCGEPMPQGEEMFKFHGYSGPCPKPPMVKQNWMTKLEIQQEEIESLRQQLSAMTLDRDEWKEAHDVVVANCKASDEQHHKDMEGYAEALAKLKEQGK